MADPAPPDPVLTAHLFPALDARLVELLRGLTPDDWNRPTIAPRWTVKDVAAHLLDTLLRRLSFGRDGYVPSPAVESRPPRSILTSPIMVTEPSSTLTMATTVGTASMAAT